MYMYCPFLSIFEFPILYLGLSSIPYFEVGSIPSLRNHLFSLPSTTDNV